VSRLYYRYDESDEYEEEFGEQLREGEVLVRRTVSFKQARPVRVACPLGTYVVKGEPGATMWVALPRLALPELKGGVGIAARAPAGAPAPSRGSFGHMGDDHLRPDKHLPEIAALIDRAQFDAMTQPDAGVVVLQGGAGSGKTTVALHRIAWLAFADKRRFRPKNMTVVVHQPALVRYVERVLPSLDVAGVRVQAYGAFTKHAVRLILPDLSRRVIDEAPAEVSRLKKHPGMLEAIRRQVRRRADEVEAALKAALFDRPGAGAVLAAWQVEARTPVIPRVEELRASLPGLKVPDDTRERAIRVLEKEKRRLVDLIDEWEELVSDRALLEACTQENPLSPVEFERAVAWTKRQIEEPEAFDDVDPSARRAIDGKELIDDDDPVCSLDLHDMPLLLNMWIERTGGLFSATRGRSTTGKELSYDHIAVDEAQDLSAVEIRPLLVAAGKSRSVTLAGDIVQKVVFDNGFDDWQTLLKQLGTEAVEVEPFRLTYRSTSEVAQLAGFVLGPLAPKEPARAVRSGAPVEAFHFEDTGEEVAFLAENLRSVMAREPNASVAVLFRYPERARFFAEMLADAEVPRLRSVEGPLDVSFAPGVDVTHVAQVKGLEYDYVVLAEANAATYPDELPARHLLHIGATRAAHQLWITSSGSAPSPLFPRELYDTE
jgi:DNA helicase II / ATP-dependent DNA helicase PcrA